MLGMITPLEVLAWCGVAIVAVFALYIVVALLKLIVDTLRGSGPVPKSRRNDNTRTKRVI